MKDMMDISSWLRDDTAHAAQDVETSTLGLQRPIRRRQLTQLEAREAAVAVREREVELREAAVQRDERSWGTVAAMLAVSLLSLIIGATLIWPGIHFANQQGWFGRANGGPGFVSPR